MKTLDHLKAVVTLLMVVLNTILWGIPVYALALLKLIFRRPGAQRHLTGAVTRTVNGWIRGNLLIQRYMLRIRWDVRGTAELRPDEWYFVNCNHQSWADLPILLEVFTGRIPFFKIFAKRQLIWLPIIGQGLWALDYPFMRRYSRSYLARHPEKAGQDREATRRACRKYRHAPVSILNFVEGTRFTAAKHRRQESPYRHLLRPKAGGLAYALDAMDGRIRLLLDTTIVYPDGQTRFWDYLGGNIRRVIVRVRPVAIPPDLLAGDYQNDPVYREAFQRWLRRLWRAKDELIASLMEADRDQRPPAGA
jgi:1-acyl-sn-glycerol-3-phosphate acyltransferase